MKNIHLIVFIVLLSCQNTTRPNNPIAIKQPVKDPKIYFDYDEIAHYRSNIEEKEIDYHPPKTNSDSLKSGVLLDNIPESINDTTFIPKLESVGYKKLLVDKNKFSGIDSIFREKKAKDYGAFTCSHVYRDMLIFKKAAKTIGIAKICFSCLANKIVGTKANTEDFGQDGDYNRLSKLLK